jgi:thiol-disulfide isomerase/thioredoxin
MNTLIIVLALTAIAFLMYKLWKPMVSPPKREVPPNTARLYFFFTNWCGFSKKAMPEWAALEKSLKTSSYYGKTHVEPVRVNCEEDVAQCTLYGINAYPTVVLETPEGIYDFKKRVTASNLKAFLVETLGQESTRL